MREPPTRLLDELSRVMTGAVGLAQGVLREADSFARSQIERILRDSDLVTREEFEAVRLMAMPRVTRMRSCSRGSKRWKRRRRKPAPDQPRNQKRAVATLRERPASKTFWWFLCRLWTSSRLWIAPGAAVVAPERIPEVAPDADFPTCRTTPPRFFPQRRCEYRHRKPATARIWPC